MVSAQRARSSQPDAEAQTILIVEDDDATNEMIGFALGNAGFRSRAVASGEEALRWMQKHSANLLLLDVRLPDMDGIEVLRAVRARSSVPIITMSGYVENKSMITTLEAGADDYIIKPFVPDELIARIRALLRRVEWTPVSDSRLVVRGLELDLAKRQAAIRGERLHLTPTEYGILAVLMRSAGQTLTHDELLNMVWGEEHAEDHSVLRINISRLRQKVEENPRHPSYIVTIPGQGYSIPLKANG
jgi:two-component system response regulator MtrA